MDKLEDIVISLELAKKLKKAGFKQEGLFWWIEKGCPIRTSKKEYSQRTGFVYDDNYFVKHDGCILEAICSAPTTEEILKGLPKHFSRQYLGIAPSLNNNAYGVYYMDSSQNITIIHEDKKLTNALAKMWIYLKENNLLGDG